MENNSLNFTETPITNKNEENIKQEEPQDLKSSLKSLCRFFSINFIKFYGIRMLYALYKLYSKIGKGKKEISFESIYDVIFSFSNLRTGLFGSVMPTLYKLLITLKDKLNIKTNERLFIVLAGFISSLIGVCIEEKTSLVNFIILSVVMRLLHILINMGIDKFSIPYPGKLVNFSAFLGVGVTLMLINFYFPQYKPIKKVVDGYALFNGTEFDELNFVRNTLKIF